MEKISTGLKLRIPNLLVIKFNAALQRNLTKNKFWPTIKSAIHVPSFSLSTSLSLSLSKACKAQTRLCSLTPTRREREWVGQRNTERVCVSEREGREWGMHQNTSHSQNVSEQDLNCKFVFNFLKWDLSMKSLRLSSEDGCVGDPMFVRCRVTSSNPSYK